MRSDPAHIETDKIIAKMEKRITREYRKAHKEVTAKWKDYLRRFEIKDEKWRQWVKNGTKTEAEYRKWRMGQIMMGKRWEEMKDTLADDYANAHNIAESIVNGYAPEVYAINHNYGTYLVESGARIDTSYTLYDKQTVERLLRDNPKLYGRPGSAVRREIRNGTLRKWNKQQITSIVMQSILQGESIPNMTKRLERVTGGNHGAAIRNARTMMTGVQNAGRLESFKRAERMGIQCRKTWVATLDSRTRHWHRELDGVTVDNDKPFVNSMGKIMFPGDPDADGANIYNCRCTMLCQIKGHEIDVRDGRTAYRDEFASMTYDEWKAEKRSHSKPITNAEDIANRMRGIYTREYRR